jgi:hypothetical protein
MGPLLAFTPVMWSTVRCCNDSSFGYGLLWGLLWTASFFPRASALVSSKGTFIYIRHSLLNANVLFCRLFFILSHPVYDQTQDSGAVFLLLHNGLRPRAPTSLSIILEALP